jgi:hypothetical protein
MTISSQVSCEKLESKVCDIRSLNNSARLVRQVARDSRFVRQRLLLSGHTFSWIPAAQAKSGVASVSGSRCSHSAARIGSFVQARAAGPATVSGLVALLKPCPEEVPKIWPFNNAVRKSGRASVFEGMTDWRAGITKSNQMFGSIEKHGLLNAH